jgi:double-GTPase-like protein
VSQGTCQKEGCTVATTGTCVLSHPIPAECPNFVQPTPPTVLPEASQASAASVAPGTAQAVRRFHSGDELGTIDASEIMRARYTHLIGIIGSTDAGKTCFLSSLYLLASSGQLPASHHFAGSFTLQAFEDRARGLRKWPGGALPNQLVDHTILKDKRQPSLLHLAIREAQEERRRFDILLTDLPGEWTDRLAMRASGADSFRFLRRADGIIFVIDGKVLRSDQRHAEVQRLRYCAERLANDVKIPLGTPIIILVAKADEFGMQLPPAAEELREHVQSLGFPAITILSAAISRTPADVANGTGVFDAVETILSHSSPKSEMTTPLADPAAISRTFQDFRG